MSKTDYYTTLGVSRDTSAANIKKAYKNNIFNVGVQMQEDPRDFLKSLEEN